MSLQFGFLVFCQKEICVNAARKLLENLTTSRVIYNKVNNNNITFINNINCLFQFLEKNMIYFLRNFIYVIQTKQRLIKRLLGFLSGLKFSSFPVLFCPVFNIPWFFYVEVSKLLVCKLERYYYAYL
jgi:hypothetical protein